MIRTEKEKMLAGELYNSRDPELLERYHFARSLLLEFNQMSSRNLKRKSEILTELLGEVGEGVWIEAPFYCDYGENIRLGNNTFLNFNCLLLDDNIISIGKNGLIGPNVQIYTATHPLAANERIIADPEERYLTQTKPVHIGDNVWIGGNTLIMPGVTIGNNVTIGAGSLVTKDIPDNSLALGSPSRVIRKL
ncbi:maltose O-acetyltransferase [Cecembia rubra]|uniref:Nodulation protein L n=2 Tax=Cecembia rubra TaxID=1485585 RepID=A0A2P8E801_9BACT|nr:maltose O-acetyltransferase [Cecembia rubra]